MRKRRARPQEQSDHHRWIVSYADFITLLFAFFVVMYAISSVNHSKYESLSDGMHSAFNNKDKNKRVITQQKTGVSAGDLDSKAEHHDGLESLAKSLSELKDGNLKMNQQDGWIELNLTAGSLFEAGDAELKPEAVLKLMRLAQKIKNLPYPVAVEGYTDNVPIETPQFPSNWELSASRAAAIGRVLNTFGVNSSRIIVTGYGDQYPVAENVTALGRSQNRRVNILITRDKKVDRILNPNVRRTQNSVISPRKSIQ